MEISVLLSKQKNLFSKTVYWLSGRKYTHASIRLEGMGSSFFSFGFKGLCEERVKLFSAKHTQRCVLYQLEVPEDIYKELRERLQRFLDRRQFYHYSRLGLILCLLHIPHRSPGSYICSQFVAELLVRTGVIYLEQDESVCLPNTLEKALIKGRLPYHVMENPFFVQV